MLVRIELGSSSGVFYFHPAAFKGSQQLLLGEFNTRAQGSGISGRVGQCRVEAVANGNKFTGKFFDSKFMRFGHIFSGTATQGQTLTAANTLADTDGIPASGTGAIAYQWLADGQAINGATSSTLLLIQSLVGKALSVRASYTDNFGQAENVTSAATSAVPAHWPSDAVSTTFIRGSPIGTSSAGPRKAPMRARIWSVW